MLQSKIFRWKKLSPFFLLFTILIMKSEIIRASDHSNRPNIIFILTDDQRWDSMGCMGNKIIKTPNLDQLASRGTLFTNMFCTTSICATSRATFLTGQYERRHLIDNFRTPLTDNQFAESFAGLLKQNGYQTAMIGKWGLGGKLPKEKYDYFDGFSGQGRYYPKGESPQPNMHLTQKLSTKAVSFIKDVNTKKPFLLQLYTKASHCQDGDPWQFQSDVKYDSLYNDVTIPIPLTANEKDFKDLPEFLQNSEARKRWKLRFANPKLFQKSVKDYYRLITGIDHLVGEVVATLKEQKLDRNTVIIFTSDNGFYLGEHGLAGKWYMHEESIRLPLIIYDPRNNQSSKKNDEMVLSVDIAPTIAALAGVNIPSSMQGESLVPLVQGKKTEWRKDFLYEHRFTHDRIPQTEGVRTKRWKYTRYYGIKPVYEELFDLENDPLEETNLVSHKERISILDELRTRTNELSKILK
jgi:arylsulfatase A-like enzyme